MKRLAYTSILAAALFAMGCGGNGSSISIVGKDADEQGREVAEAVCEQEASCGSVSLEFTQTENGFECQGTIEDADYDECYADAEEDFQGLFEDCDFTEEEERDIEACFNAALSQSCITQSEVDEYCDEVEAGNEEATLGDLPPECDAYFDAVEACYEQS